MKTTITLKNKEGGLVTLGLRIVGGKKWYDLNGHTVNPRAFVCESDWDKL